MNTNKGEVMNAETNGEGIAIFYTSTEGRTDENGQVDVGRYTVTVTHTLTETKPIKNLLVKFIPAVFNKDGSIAVDKEIVISADEPELLQNRGSIRVKVFDKEIHKIAQNIKVRFVRENKKPAEAPNVTPVKTPTEEPQEELQTQETQKESFLKKIIQKLKSILRRLLNHEEKQ